MASNILAGDQLNFTRMGIASVDEIKVVLADILRCEIKPQDLPKSITSCSELTTGRHKLRPEQQRLCCPSPPAVPDYNKFDVSLLYTLIRNLCPQLKPTQDWGKPPSITEFQIGDDIERLRVFRNEMFAHLDSSCVEDVVFTSKWQDLEQIFQRMQTFLKSKGISVDYGKKLATIEKSDFGFEDMEKYKIILEGILHILKENDENGAVNIPPERFMAYMKKRKTTVRHARGIVVGCAGAGKTTLLYRLMGKSLDEIEEIKSTRELHVYEHIFFVRNGDLSATEDESSKKPLIRIPVSELEQKRNNKMEIEAGNEASFESIQAGKDDNTRQNTALASKKNDTDESHNVKIDQQLTGDVRRKDERNDQQLAKDVMGKILDATENEISISMIDFAGQFAYYACHQIYMRSEAFYILVLDMSKDFYEIICSKTDECEDSIFSTWTYEDFVHT
ncbi:uncharacterized protein LOC133179912 [Saccostrea echinata]|uniref:uncharacterized protein LOC133179912 n=1 Tax=Saccostrea echinata TaxID=191078 RepID=UPI002A839D0B|nr:uncharacterized protein LOC133179912 [Saccostrea echinata]